jgi:uncharacterized RDD family membrane protein YckC
MSANAPVGMSQVRADESAASEPRQASRARAGFWIRFGGSLIDGILLSVVSVILRAVLKGGAGAGLALLVEIVYFVGLVGSSSGQTLGMRAVGIRVVSLETGRSIGYGRAFIRWAMSIVSYLVVLLGYLWMLWDKENQCWHDKLAGDVVVPA